MKGTGDKGGEVRAFLTLVPCSLFLVSCSPAPSPVAVRIDVARLAPSVAPVRVVPTLPRPPAGLAAKSAALPGSPATRLVAEAGIDGATLAREVEDAQERSLAALRARLIAVYEREGDRFARAQLRELGDPYRKALQTLYPGYRKEFEAYAAKRAYPAARLSYFVGTPDPNPKDLPPAADAPPLSPLGRYFFDEASRARKRLKTLDAEFDGVVVNLLASVRAVGDDAKVATLAAIAANRESLNRQAIGEATLPLGPRGGGAIRLSLARAGIARVPAVAPRSIALPAVSPPPPAPRVESPRVLADARARLLGEVRIWAAQKGYVLKTDGRDATSEFIAWKNQRAGASPNSPTSSAAP